MAKERKCEENESERVEIDIMRTQENVKTKDKKVKRRKKREDEKKERKREEETRKRRKREIIK